MLKVSEIISKEVVSIYEGEILGTIKNVVLNSTLTKVIKFVFFNDDTDTESCVLVNNLFSISEDGILVKNMTKVEFCADEENNPINKKIFSVSANDLGVITDILINEKGNVLKFTTSKNLDVFPLDILKFEQVCIVNNAEKQVKISSFKPKNNLTIQTDILENIQVKIVKMDEMLKTKKATPTFPTKVTTNINNLIGKKVTKTITGLNNEIIIKQYNTISKHTLDMAKIHNKTTELLYNALG